MKRIYLVLITIFCWGALWGQCPSGDFIFTTQQQVDDFALNYPGCTEILGDMMIGINSSSSTTDIANLNGLSQIEAIQGRLIIRSNNLLVNLVGFSNLNFVGDDLEITQNASLSNFQGLETLNVIGENLTIRGNHALINMEGLNNLDTIGHNFIVGNYDYGGNAIEDFSGLENLKFIGYHFCVRHSYNLVNFNGLSSLHTIGSDFVVGYQYFSNYPDNGIVDFTGLEGLTVIGRDFHMYENPMLEDFSGLENLTTVNRYLKIIDNESLTTLEQLNGLSYQTILHLTIGGNINLSHCSTSFICNYIENDASYSIGNNNTGCNSDLEVAIDCSTSSCPPVGIFFDTQAKIDSFSINYPNCTAIGEVYINGVDRTEITNLNGLSQLTSAGNIEIISNDAMENLTGLHNLNTVEGNLIVADNDGLTNLSGFANLNNIGGMLRIINNNYLTDLTGFDNLQNIGLDLSIINNDALTNLAGLESLNTIERQLIISNNYGIINLSGIDNIDYSSINDLQITNNSNLSVCSSSGICGHLENGSTSTISNNAPDCNSTFEVLLMCTNNGGFIFTTQAEIDSFPILYPDHDSIIGNVIIQGENLTSITDLSGLSQISSIGGILIIKDNEALSNLSGLQLLTAAEGGIHIDNNDALQNLHALANVTNMQGELTIRNNAILTGLGGLHNIVGPISFLTITDNPQLRWCNNASICAHLWNAWYISRSFTSLADISGNIAGTWGNPACSTEVEVAAGCPQYLPIELTHFQAQIQQKTTLLTWQTATETHNEGFEIQRSKDGTTWEKIGWQDGQGDTQTPHDYTHTDESPRSGTSYYRLKQIDFDGAFSYSDIVEVDYASTDISIYPNPVKNTLHIADLNDNTIQNITIFDQMGRQILLQNTSVNTLDVSALSSGVYIIQVVLDSGVFSDRFIVK